MKTFLLGLFLISPVVLLVLYTASTTHRETSPTIINVSNLKLVPPVAIINEITQKIEEGDLEDALDKINTELPDPNIVSSDGVPLIVLAAEKDYTDIVSALLQKGADPNKSDLNTSETALIKAIKNRSFDTISILLNAGADPNLGTKQGVTPLGLAIDLKDETLASHLLSSGAINGISKENLLLYAFKKNPIGVGLMLSGGVSPSVTDQDNNTPLIISAANGDLESAKYLVSYRANINAKNKFGMTPLLYALKGKHWQTAEYLINNGAKINISNIYGQDALFWAAYHGNADLVQKLLMRGANYQKKTRKGQTALQMARALGHKDVAKMIEDFIAYKNLPRDEKGNIIFPKVNQTEVAPSVSQNDDSKYIDNDIVNAVKTQTQQNQSTSQNMDNQVEMPQMPSEEGMSAIMSMAGGAQGGNMGEMIKKMQDMGTASQNGNKTQQTRSAPANVPNGMNMTDISKMIPAGTLPEGIDINSLASMSPDQLKKMGVPEDQIANITKAQQQMKQTQGATNSANGFRPKDLETTSSNTYANGMPKTQINKLQTSGN